MCGKCVVRGRGERLLFCFVLFYLLFYFRKWSIYVGVYILKSSQVCFYGSFRKERDPQGALEAERNQIATSR